jgi:lysozyme
MLAADHEDPDVSGQKLKEFLDAVEDRVGRSPVIYSGHVLKEQLAGSGYRPKRRLWLAQYASTPTLPEGVDSYWLWQWTDKGTVPGINPPTDCNDFQGSDADFAHGWAGHYDQPVPPEIDIEVTVTVTVEAPPGVKVKVVTNDGAV